MILTQSMTHIMHISISTRFHAKCSWANHQLRGHSGLSENGVLPTPQNAIETNHDSVDFKGYQFVQQDIYQHEQKTQQERPR